MRTRRLLAALTLAALPLAAGTLQAGPIRATADAAHERHVTERPSGPQWAFILGGHDGDTTGCWLITGGWAEVWCRVYAL